MTMNVQGPGGVQPPKTDRTEAEAPGRRIKSGDTLGRLAKQMVVDAGEQPTKANVAKALAALSQANPTLAADGGRKMKIGAPVNVPTFDGNGGWVSAGAATGAGRPSTASTATASQQMVNAKLDKELGEMAKRFSSFMATPNAQEKIEIAAKLDEVKNNAPQLLETPAARLLKARMLPDPAPAAAAPPRPTVNPANVPLEELTNAAATLLEANAQPGAALAGAVASTVNQVVETLDERPNASGLVA